MNLAQAIRIADDPILTPRAELVLALTQLVQKVRTDEAQLCEEQRRHMLDTLPVGER